MYSLIRFVRFICPLILMITSYAWGEVVEYEFDISQKTVDFTGKQVTALAVGGSIPAPTITATVGDTLRITFNNRLETESSIHWHGVLLPNDQDGVPYLTTPPIKAKSSFSFEYPVIHAGTYWYHSHTGLQEQRGVYGAIVFKPATDDIVVDHDRVLVLSDWTDEDPNRVMHNLKKSDDYYALKKDSVQSWLKAVRHSGDVVKNKLSSAWARMGAMDISDVGYDAFLTNGETVHRLSDVKPGETVRLRIINAGASSYFYFQFAGGPMTIVAADGVDVQPITVDKQRIAIAETFDVLVTLPNDGKAYEFRASSEDGTGFSTALLGSGEVVAAPVLPKPDPFAVDHSSHQMADGNHGMNHHSAHKNFVDSHSAYKYAQHNQHNAPADMIEYERLRARQPTTFDQAQQTQQRRIVNLDLTGDMERYAWSFNNKVLSEDSKIMIRRGEVVQFVLDNKTMMHHPLHLHGHFFRVLNGQGEYSPLKHTVNVPPMQTVRIEFLADQEKDWFFHCHNLYHMKTGMSRIVSYEGSSQSSPETLKPLFADRQWFYFTDASAQSHFSALSLRAETTRHALELEYEWGYGGEYEVEGVYERYINRFLSLYAGGEVEQEREHGEQERESLAMIGIHYVLPLFIEADIRADSDGNARLSVGSEIQLSDRTGFRWSYNTDDEYSLALDYELSKQWVLTGGLDDHFDWGAGVEYRY